MDLEKILEKEIDLIQGCINRMSQHSFYLKGWVITLLGILIALKPKDLVITGYFMLVIVITFWYLNAKYLNYEQQYRELYEWVVEERLKGNRDYLYRLNLKKFDNDVKPPCKLMFQNTLITFYLPIAICVVIFIVAMIFKTGDMGSTITIIMQ